ncbi:AIPR family protein [Flavobacterium soli]|uniref:AIPR family protein n=1 Tax=Flavobacterium soli TaxID=344881 RepID=UPI00040C219F|nr:AIPR family protein [Flavobacterium soli]
MEVSEFLKYRKDLLDESKDEDGFTSEPSFINLILPSMLEAKLIDSEECNESYYKYDSEKLKINGYLVNESGERLQLFILNEDSINITQTDDDLKISQKNYYETQFNRATKFLNKAIKRHFDDEIQDSSPVKALVSQISSSQGIDQFDVIEIFLISATATVSTRGDVSQPKRFEFDDDTLKISYTKKNEKVQKEMLIIKRLIDLNFLYNVLISQGNREPLTIDFKSSFDDKIEVIKAADEENFESYLCVLPAKVLSDLYKKHSSRLLEKNVRSFLQFRGVNQGIRETIRLNPEKFIAYNNGITITSTGKETEEINGKIYLKSLTDFQIVNGGQTTASIYFTNKDGFNIDKVKVMAKINVAKNVSEENLDDLISKISQYSNSQSKVSNVDLRSRNPQLTKLKTLSESIITPTGRKWFFEKSKGDFNTKLRIAGSAKSRIEKEFPKQSRFSKEELGKYFTAWGDQPYVVKKGGEKVFRHFIEELGGDGNEKRAVDINRNFFETLIAKIILFRELEKIYGQGKNSMGQIRSAVIPYSISILYKYFDGGKGDKVFDLYKIWNSEGLGTDLTQYMTNLMRLTNELIKKYSQSDDLGEYSKKKELWDDISLSKEILGFLGTDDSKLIFEKYSISKKEVEKNLKTKAKSENVNFKQLKDCINIHSKTPEFYKKINSIYWDELTDHEKNKLSNISATIQQKDDLTPELILFEESLMHRIRINNPEIFDQISFTPNVLIENTLNYIIRKYNNCIDKSEDIIVAFEKIGDVAKSKEIKYNSVFIEIGKLLNSGNAPTTKQIYYASYYVSIL